MRGILTGGEEGQGDSKLYNCYEYAIELGFTETEARLLQASKVGLGQDATVLRRLAKAKGLASMKSAYPMPTIDALQSTSRPVITSTDSKLPAKRKRTIRRKTNKGG